MMPSGTLLTSAPRQCMGALLIDAGRLSAQDAAHILRFQRESGLRFGELGQALGFLTAQDVSLALSVQFPCLRNMPAAPAWLQRWSALLVKIERVQTPAGQPQLLARLSQPVRPFVLAFANAHAMNLVAASRAFFDALVSADVVLRDGSGMAMLLKLLHMPPGLNLNGTDLIPQLVRQFNGRGIALFGTRPAYLAQAQAVVQELAPHSRCEIANGFLLTDDYVVLAATQRPALIVLGMGMPRQEEVALALRAALDHPCLIVCGGAIIDFLGGRAPRAPLWMRRMGLEWLFRLGLEPRRLFARYVIGNPLFLARALRLAALNRG